jgi:hypothetical protein
VSIGQGFNTSEIAEACAFQIRCCFVFGFRSMGWAGAIINDLSFLGITPTLLDIAELHLPGNQSHVLLNQCVNILHI